MEFAENWTVEHDYVEKLLLNRYKRGKHKLPSQIPFVRLEDLTSPSPTRRPLGDPDRDGSEEHRDKRHCNTFHLTAACSRLFGLQQSTARSPYRGGAFERSPKPPDIQTTSQKLEESEEFRRLREHEYGSTSELQQRERRRDQER